LDDLRLEPEITVNVEEALDDPNVLNQLTGSKLTDQDTYSGGCDPRDCYYHELGPVGPT